MNTIYSTTNNNDDNLMYDWEVSQFRLTLFCEDAFTMYSKNGESISRDIGFDADKSSVNKPLKSINEEADFENFRLKVNVKTDRVDYLFIPKLNQEALNLSLKNKTDIPTPSICNASDLTTTLYSRCQKIFSNEIVNACTQRIAVGTKAIIRQDSLYNVYALMLNFIPFSYDPHKTTDIILQANYLDEFQGILCNQLTKLSAQKFSVELSTSVNGKEFNEELSSETFLLNIDFDFNSHQTVDLTLMPAKEIKTELMDFFVNSILLKLNSPFDQLRVNQT